MCCATGRAIVSVYRGLALERFNQPVQVGQHLSSLRGLVFFGVQHRVPSCAWVLQVPTTSRLSSGARGVARTVPPAISRSAVVVGLPQGGTRGAQPRINCAVRSVASRTNSNLPTSGDPNVMWADALQRSDRSRAIVIGGRKLIRRAMLPVGAHPEKFEDATRNAGGRQMRLTRQYTRFVLYLFCTSCSEFEWI